MTTKRQTPSAPTSQLSGTRREDVPEAVRRLINNAGAHQPKLTVKGGGKLSIEMPVKPPGAGFQARVLNKLRTPEEAAAGINSPFIREDSPTPPASDAIANIGPDDDVELNVTYRFRLEPDDGQPVAFVGALIAQAVVERGGTQRTWAGLYRTRGGKVISEIIRDDGRARNVSSELGDRFRTVKVFESLELALASIRSAVLRNQLLSDMGMLQTKFID